MLNSRMFQAYVTAALWSSDDDGEPLDSNYDVADIAGATLRQMREDCASFARLAEALPGFEQWSYDAPYDVSEQLGHDFWLTRNCHGAGFWDGDWPKDLGAALTELAHRYREVYLYVYEGVVYAA